MQRRIALLLASLALVATVPFPALAAEPGFHSAWVDQSAFPTLLPGATATLTVRFRNTGTETWQRGVLGRQVNLGIRNDDRRFFDLGMAVSWLSPDRPATTSEAVVPPGAIGTFAFTVRAPSVPGTYRLPLRPVADGVTWLEDQGVFLDVTSDQGFHARWVSQSPFPTLKPGETSPPLSVTFRNTGTRTWRRSVASEQLNLGVRNDDRSWSQYALGWLSADRVATTNEDAVAPGATGTFTFRMTAPTTPGTYRVPLRPVVDGVTWLEDEGVFMELVVAATAAAPSLVDTVVQSGLRIPWDLAFAPDGRMFVTERVGNLLIYASGAPGAAQLANHAIAGVQASGEAGLMSITLDPAFTTNGLLYLCASRSDEGEWRNQVLRYRVSGNAIAFDGYVIRRGMRASTNHDGCRLRFGPDGKLWATMGDAERPESAQDPNALNGKVLRVNADGSIPPDNPILPGAAGRSAVYTMGHRNPQGLSFQPGTGTPFAVEHGPDADDEINVLVAGGNYGWPRVTGSDGPGGFLDPVWASGRPTIATSGGIFVTGTAWGAWSGSLFVAQLKESDLRRFAVQGMTVTMAETLFDGKYGRLRSPVLAADGSLYVTTSNGSGDRVVRITPTAR